MGKIPNAKHTGATGGATILATIIVWSLGRAHVALSAEEGSIFAGALSATAVFVWHYGFVNILRTVTFGDRRQATAQSN